MQMTIMMTDLTDEEVLTILDAVAKTKAHVYVDPQDEEIEEEKELIPVTIGDIVHIDVWDDYFLINQITETNIQFLGVDGVFRTVLFNKLEDMTLAHISPEEAYQFRRDLKEQGGIEL